MWEIALFYLYRKIHGIFDVTNSANTRKIAWVLAWMYPELRDQCHVGVAKTFESARKVENEKEDSQVLFKV